MDTTRNERLADRYARRKDVSALCMGVSGPDLEWFRHGDRPYFIASITKLFTTSLIMQLRSAGRLALDDPIGAYLDAALVTGLNVQDGVDRSADITVRQLLAHTSGIANYFEQEGPDGTTLIGEMLRSDRGWTFEETLERTRSMKPRFAPGTIGKAYYSDTNYQLLGAIIEALSGSPYEDVLVQRIIVPLGLQATWLFTPATIARFDEVAPMLYGSRPLRIPDAMASFGPDGGIVSTAREQVAFLRAFMSGELFPQAYLEEMTAEWLRVFWPLEYGVGIMRFALPRYFSIGRAVPAMVGHSGASGAVLYHVPERNLFLAATVNQVKKRSLSYQLLARI